jgi:hypothetical protein
VNVKSDWITGGGNYHHLWQLAAIEIEDEESRWDESSSPASVWGMYCVQRVYSTIVSVTVGVYEKLPQKWIYVGSGALGSCVLNLGPIQKRILNGLLQQGCILFQIELWFSIAWWVNKWNILLSFLRTWLNDRVKQKQLSSCLECAIVGLVWWYWFGIWEYAPL